MMKLTRTAAAYALGIYLAIGWRSGGWNPGEWPQREWGTAAVALATVQAQLERQRNTGKHGRGKSPRNGGAVRKRAAFFVAYPP